MKKRLLLLAVLAVAVAGLIAAAAPVLRTLSLDGSDSIPTFVVERAEFVRTVYTDGNLKAVDATPLGPPPEIRHPLRIAWLAVDGSSVREGDVVIRFDPSEMEEQLRVGRHDRDTTQSQIDQRDVRQQGNRVNLEKDALMADLELDYASRFQSKDAQIFSRAEIIESEIDQALAETKRDHATETSRMQSDLAQAEMDLLAIERRKAELKIGLAEQILEGLEVRAPHDGLFVMKQWRGRTREVGEMAWGGNAIAELPKLDAMEALVYVLEADAGGLEVGLPATLTLESQPGEVYEATVKQVAALAQPRSRSSPVQYFSATLSMSETDPRVMKPGQRVDARVDLDRREDVISVPRQAIFEEDGKKIVYVASGGEFVPTDVEVGTAGPARIVIEKGLREGQRVALRDPTQPVERSGGGDDGDESAGPVTP